MNRALSKLKGLLTVLAPELFDTPQINLVRNISYTARENQPKILISYITNLFFSDQDRGQGRTNSLEIAEIVRIFAQKGFSIDVVNCNDVKQIKYINEVKYNVIFGFGEVFYQMSTLQPFAKTILYMTEHHPEFSFAQEQLRIDYYYQRKGKKVNTLRSGMFYTTDHLSKIYDHVITMSETEPFIAQYKKVYQIFPTGIVNKSFAHNVKNHFATRKHFLWFGSSHAIHKGLDLLNDVFEKNDDITLHICGLRPHDKAFLNIPQKINIKEYGHVDVNSDMFLALVANCTYVILPSCSEACSTGIVTGMLHGLIPVVMRNSGFNSLDDHAIYLDDYKVPYLTHEILKLSNNEADALQQRSDTTLAWARQTFLLPAFCDNFTAIVNQILC